MKNTPVVTNNGAQALTKKEIQKQHDAVDIKQLPKSRIISNVFTNDKAAPRGIPYGIIFLICIFTVAALFITYLSVRVNEVNNEISSLNSELADVREATADAKAKIFEKKDITLIRETAESYGMVRAEYLPAHYITIDTEDKITVYSEDEDNAEYSFTSLLSAFGNSIASFIEYMR